MSVNDPFIGLDFDDAEVLLYKLLIQITKSPKKNSSALYRKIKASDLVKISKYSKPKVYGLIKRLGEKGLIKIDNTHPMFLQLLDPELAINKLVKSKKKQIEEDARRIIKELNSIPIKSLNYPFSEVPQLSFIVGLENYYNTLKDVLLAAKSEIILIIGYLAKYEDVLVGEIIKSKLKEDLKIRILYGNQPKLKILIKNNILNPNGLSIEQKDENVDIKAIKFSPPIRITIVDGVKLIMTLLKENSENMKVNVEEVSFLYSENQDLIEYAQGTYSILRTTASVELVQDLMKLKKK